MTACYGTTEYPEDMSHITLRVTNEKETNEILYAYKCRSLSLANVTSVSAIIPDIETKVNLYSETEADGYANEGYAFSPMFTLGLKKKLKNKEVFESWLNLEKAD